MDWSGCFLFSWMLLLPLLFHFALTLMSVHRHFYFLFAFLSISNWNSHRRKLACDSWLTKVESSEKDALRCALCSEEGFAQCDCQLTAEKSNGKIQSSKECISVEIEISHLHVERFVMLLLLLLLVLEDEEKIELYLHLVAICSPVYIHHLSRLLFFHCRCFNIHVIYCHWYYFPFVHPSSSKCTVKWLK